MTMTLSHIYNETRERKCYLFLVTISTWARPGPLDYQSRYNRTSSSWKRDNADACTVLAVCHIFESEVILLI